MSPRVASIAYLSNNLLERIFLVVTLGEINLASQSRLPGCQPPRHHPLALFKDKSITAFSCPTYGKDPNSASSPPLQHASFRQVAESFFICKTIGALHYSTALSVKRTGSPSISLFSLNKETEKREKNISLLSCRQQRGLSADKMALIERIERFIYFVIPIKNNKESFN